MSDFIDGHRWPTEPDVAASEAAARTAAVAGPTLVSGGCPGEGFSSEGGPASREHGAHETSGEVPADRRDLPAALPRFDVKPGYSMVADTVALHFHFDAVPALAALFPSHADALHAAALDVEMEAERQQDLAYGRRPA